MWYSWFVDDIKIRASDTLVGINSIIESVISRAFSNPFTESTRVGFFLNNAGSVSICLFGTDGKPIYQREFVNLSAGHQYITLDGGDIPTGFYFYKLTTEEGTSTGKLIRK